MSEGRRFSSFGEDDPASRRGPGVTGQRGDEEPEPAQGAEVREIDLVEEDEDERDPAKVEAAERVERLREAAREEGEDEATVVFPPAKEGEDTEREGAAEVAGAGAPRPYEVGTPQQAAADAQDQEASRPVGAATVDISPPADQAERADEPPAGMTLATPPGSEEADRAAAAGAEGGALDGVAAVAAAEAAPAPRSGALLATDAEAVRRQFLDIQAGFVDEPRQAVEQAGELVEALHRKVLESLDAERGELNKVLDRDEPSTEDLRLALRAYRAYVDHLLGLRL
jgi:hypothetical protein